MIWQAEKRAWLGSWQGVDRAHQRGNTGICPGLRGGGFAGSAAHPNHCRDDEPGAGASCWRLWRPMELTEGRLGHDRKPWAAPVRSPPSGSRSATCLLQQFSNPPTPRSTTTHPTGPEKSGTTPKATVGWLVAGVGTGGTITGVNRLHSRGPPWGQPLVSVAVRTGEQPVISQAIAGAANWCLGPTKSRGIGAGFVTR